MGKSRKKEAAVMELDSTAWMVTFADLLQLLLTFFVLLISMSSLDVKSLKSMFSFFPGAIGVLQMSDYAGVVGPQFKPMLRTKKVTDVDLKRLFDKTIMLVPGKGAEGLVDDIGVSMEKKGIVVTFPEKLLFITASEKINPVSYPMLDELANVLKITRNKIEVHGHTDDKPIKTAKFSSNWDLSLARGLEIVKYFVEKGVDPGRLSAVGFGEYKPLYPNDTKEHRVKNRRVEIFIIQRK